MLTAPTGFSPYLQILRQINGTPSGLIVADCPANSRHDQIDSDFTRVTSSVATEFRFYADLFVMSRQLSSQIVQFNPDTFHG